MIDYKMLAGLHLLSLIVSQRVLQIRSQCSITKHICLSFMADPQ